jgi:eukaryotic-like serine/threonine-protein kinase
VDDRRRRAAYVASVVVVSHHARSVAGRYALLDQIGAGGMGSVWRARDTRTGDVVAVKVLGRHSASLLARFVREQAIRVRHPHVVAPTGWAAEDDLVLLAMDLVPGGSVQQLLDEHGPLPVGYVARLLEQLLMALAAVHAAGLVHRDVKPANLLLDATGAGDPHLRLGDFGVAAPIADRRFTTVPGAIGTDGYMAPEQARGAPPDPCQDLYAVGRVGLQLLTGLPPAHQGEIGSSRLRPLLERLLVVDPEQRLASAAAALRLLRRLDVPAEPGPVVPDRLPPLPRGRRTRSAPDGPGAHRSHTDWPAWLGIAGCVGVLLACAVVVGRLLG